mmetsp:Transcript_92982/g.250929  ORF Transcript_92982/g.250929 Transcript_92982/m.250929 type:complete len:147 (+) Transcript_92982:69-509(+)
MARLGLAATAAAVVWFAVLASEAAASDDSVFLELAADDELDWTAGSTLGLQRGAKLHRRARATGARTLSGASVLGLQRSMSLSKQAPPPSEGAPVALPQERGTMPEEEAEEAGPLALQRSFRVQKAPSRIRRASPGAPPSESSGGA